ncbi:choice-of-anchor A family protein [Kitasatospora sp. NPDC088391]|uniref:choice-of-anchor A family protein n=1 Tax=Kitasatospora sp. NPDC088391 TaxID=3364074 RepID=UPI0037FBEF42
MRTGVRTRNPLLRFAVVTALVAAPVLTLAAIGQADQLAPPLGPCVGNCPNPYPNDNNNGDFAGYDNNLNVYVGGNYTVQGRAAEAEGKIVTIGNLKIDKAGGGRFDMGVAGVGSRVPPQSGTDHVTVGGNLDIEQGNILGTGGSDSKGTVWGNVVYGGQRQGAGTTDITPDGQLIQRADAVAAYTGLTPIIEGHSDCMKQQTATGVVLQSGNTYTFKGDGTSARQVFDFGGNIGAAGTLAGIEFTDIPAGATVIVNMTGTDVLINTYSGNFPLPPTVPGDSTNQIMSKLMWNFPNATDVTISGVAQFMGSIMAGQPGSTTTLTNPGTNGRVYLAGNLVQENSSSGTELHAFPFDGDLPVCTTPTPTPSPSDSTSPSPSPSDSTSPSPSPSPSDSTSPSPSPSPSDSTSPSPSPSPSDSGSPSPSPSSSSASPSPSGSTSSAPAPSGSTPGTPKPVPSSPSGPSLPSTGDGLVAPAAGAAAVLLGLGGGVIALARRGRGRHS